MLQQLGDLLADKEMQNTVFPSFLVTLGFVVQEFLSDILSDSLSGTISGVVSALLTLGIINLIKKNSFFLICF